MDSTTVQRQQNHGFSSVACDMTIEQTLNRGSKTKGGKNKLIYILPVITASHLRIYIPNILGMVGIMQNRGCYATMDSGSIRKVCYHRRVYENGW